MFIWVFFGWTSLLLGTAWGDKTEQLACSAKRGNGFDVAYLLCPTQDSTFDVTQSDVWFKFTEQGDRLDIICNKALSADQLETYLETVPKLKKDSVNLRTLTLKGCPVPSRSKSFSTWLSILKSPAEGLRYLKFRSDSRRDEVLLKSKHFEGLENLTTLEIWGSINTLGPKLLSKLISLERFRYRRGDMLTSVHELAFQQNKKLRKIEILNSGLSTIHKDTFKGLTHLESLDLGYNKITSVPEELLTDLHRLKELILRYNSISELPQNLLLKNPSLVVFAAQNLNGGRNFKIPANLFQNSVNLEILRLQRNSLTVLPDGLFEGLRNLKVLELNENNLENSAITKEMLDDLDSLVEINLSRNKLTSPLAHHLHPVRDTLRKINLKENLLSTFERDWATNFVNLEEIDLRSNNIKGALHQRDFRFKKSKVKVNFQNNRIDRVELDQKIDSCEKPKVKLVLKNNSIDCDCFAYKLLPIIVTRSNKPKFCFLVEGLEHQECPNKMGAKLKDVIEDSLNCQIE